jgi:hypothetical protein
LTAHPFTGFGYKACPPAIFNTLCHTRQFTTPNQSVMRELVSGAFVAGNQLGAVIRARLNVAHVLM